jgi:hypothetical protein
MRGLLKNTTFETAICSELSRSVVSDIRVPGDLDFFVDSSHMWGIELVRNGSTIGEHINRFCPQHGKYAGLQSIDYVVVDFRCSLSNVRQHPNRATAFFNHKWLHMF